jgi:hypothetical protein
MSSTKLTTDNIESLDASKLSGDLPAIDGSNLTGIGDFMVSPNEPTASENPSGGVGTLWMNHSSGESYILTNASTNSNVWTNIGSSGTGDIFKPPYSYQGTQYGYTVGGESSTNNAQRWSFSSSGQSTSWGGLSRNFHGQTQAGKGTDYAFIHGQTAWANHNTAISKMQYATANSSSSWGNIGFSSQTGAGTTDSDNDYFFICYGHTYGGANQERISKTSQNSRQNWGTMGSLNRDYGAGVSDTTNAKGYVMGGDSNGWPPTNTIFQITHASETTNALVSGTLPSGVQSRSGNVSSSTHGHCVGGHFPFQSKVQRMSFASNSTTSNHCDLHVAKWGAHGASGTTHGFAAGGVNGGGRQEIEKFSYASQNSINSWGTFSPTIYHAHCGGTHS